MTPWSGQLPVPARYSSRRGSVPDTASRAMTLQQVLDLVALVEEVLANCVLVDTNPYSPIRGQRITMENTTMYHMSSFFVEPLTKPFKCSFNELVAVAAQWPRWFVSHWWGERTVDTTRMLQWHAKCHGLENSTTYWICTYANNQHDVSGELGGGVMESPFVRAILSDGCEGTVLLLDCNATPFSRIWCVLEFYCSISYARAESKDKKYDICAMILDGTQRVNSLGEGVGSAAVEGGPALLMDTGDGRMEGVIEKEGGVFPREVATVGSAVKVSEANASNEDDKRGILKILAGVSDPVAAPPATSDGYDQVDRTVHEYFCPAAMCTAAGNGDVHTLKRLIEEFPALVDSQNVYLDTPLLSAIVSCNDADEPSKGLEGLRLLLQAKADPNKPGLQEHVFPMRWAVQVAARADATAESMAALAELIDKKADVNIANPQFQHGISPLMTAVMARHAPSLQLLIGAGGNVEQKTCDQMGFAPIHMAVKFQDLSCLRLVVEARADLNAMAAHGITPCFIATQLNFLDGLVMLINSNANLMLASSGITPLALACLQKNQQALTLITSTLKAVQPMASPDSNAVGCNAVGSVSIVDTDGDINLYELSATGGLRSFLNGELKQEHNEWMQVDVGAGQVRDASGALTTVAEGEQRAEQFAQLEQLARKAGAVWIDVESAADGTAPFPPSGVTLQVVSASVIVEPGEPEFHITVSV